MTGNINREQCPNCKKSTSYGIIRCDGCGILFGEWDREQADRLDALAPSVADRIASQAIRRFWGHAIWVLGLLSILLGASIFSLYRYVDSAIKERFAEPRIQEVMEAAARAQSSEIMESVVKPAVSGLNQFVAEQKRELLVAVENTKAMQMEAQSLAEQTKRLVEPIQRLAKIVSLEAAAVGGSREAFRQLGTYGETDPEARALANAAVFRIVDLFNTLRVNGTLQLPEGRKEIQDELARLLSHGDPLERALAARTIAQRGMAVTMTDAICRQVPLETDLLALAEEMSALRSKILHTRVRHRLDSEPIEEWCTGYFERRGSKPSPAMTRSVGPVGP